MKKLFLLPAFLFCIINFSFTQSTQSFKQTIILKMPGETGVNGTNGANIAFHPIQKKYYAAMAGNSEYPISVFDIKGKKLSPDDLAAGFDVRGLWYNTVTKTIQGNGYNDFGWTNFKLDAKGIPTGNTVFLEGMYQPGEQSVGTFDAKNKVVYFLSGKKVIEYNSTTGIAGKEYALNIITDSTVADDAESTDLPYRYNHTTVAYTGIAKAEFGLLNTDEKKIEFYDKSTGRLTKTISFPENAVCSDAFNFCYANGQFWLFDKDNRLWIGYK